MRPSSESDQEEAIPGRGERSTGSSVTSPSSSAEMTLWLGAVAYMQDLMFYPLENICLFPVAAG